MTWPTECTISSISRHYRTLLRSCARHSSLDVGQKLHATITTTGLIATPNSFLRNTLLHMYAACHDSISAHKLFDEIPICQKDTIDWTTLMVCHSRTGSHLYSLKLFAQMRKHQILTDDVTITCVFNCCAKLSDEKFAFQVHSYMVKTGFDFSVKACNSLMNMYVKCRLVDEAKRVFNQMTVKSVVSWTVMFEGVIKCEGFEKGKLFFNKMPEKNEVTFTIMISTFIENGLVKEAFNLLKQMIFDYKINLNFVTLCSLLSSCAISNDAIIGRWLHSYTVKGFECANNIMVNTSLVDMYAKCGRINTSFRVFDKMPKRNVVTWNALISGLAIHGNHKILFKMFSRMVKEVKPDEITFTCILTACSHSGLVNQGRRFFNEIDLIYGINPSIEHYACIVDLLGRAGYIEEAEDIIKKMPMEPNEIVLGSLLGACSVHRKVNLGIRLMSELCELYPNNTEYHILMSNMYDMEGKSEKSDTIRRVLKERGIKKIPGMSSYAC